MGIGQAGTAGVGKPWRGMVEQSGQGIARQVVASRASAGIRKMEVTLAVAKAQYAAKQQAGVKRERKSVIIDRELARLFKIHGRLDATIVLNAAASPANPLHPYYEWDDAEAAVKWRLQQATNMLVGSKMVAFLTQAAADAKPIQVRQYLAPFRGEGFKMRNQVLNDVDMRAAQVEKKISILRGWCDETVDIHELRRLRRAILKALPP